MTLVAACPACRALVNRQWDACLVCRTPMVKEEPMARGCWRCDGARHWLSMYGRVICARCHPPMVPAIVTGWIE